MVVHTFRFPLVKSCPLPSLLLPPAPAPVCALLLSRSYTLRRTPPSAAPPLSLEPAS